MFLKRQYLREWGLGDMRKKVILFITGLLLITVGALAGCGGKEKEATSAGADNADEHVIRIGYQKNGPLVILKSLGSLEKRLESMDYTVEWKEFQEGPALVEALNSGAIDMGRTGNSPPIFAQAAGTDFISLAAGKPKFYGSGVLVPKDSPIKTIADLKGKKVGFAKGSSSHYLLVKVLGEAGISYKDITPAFLTPGDARVAFEQRNIDAIVVWDPYTASTEINADGTLLINGEGLSTDRDFFIANRAFMEGHGEIADIVIEEVEQSSDWANENHEELTKLLAPILNIDEDSIKKSIERREYGVDEINEDIIEEQQEIADTFYELGIIPEKLDVSDVME